MKQAVPKAVAQWLYDELHGVFQSTVWGIHGQKGWDKSWKENKAGVDLRNEQEYEPACAPLCVGSIKRWA